MEIKNAVIEVLKDCYDPEIPVNIYELGLVYEINVDPVNNVHVLMTLTSPMCPVAETLPKEVEEKIKKLEGIGTVQEAAKLELGLL
jgi:metal-sulfur cluster biosynthetic enzyme